MPPFQAYTVGGDASPLPRALPWAFLDRPFGAERGDATPGPETACRAIRYTSYHGPVQPRGHSHDPPRRPWWFPVPCPARRARRAGPGGARAEEKPLAGGAKVPNGHSLIDLRGNRRPLHDFKDHKALVVVFVGADCPLSNLYLPELIELEKKLRKQSVQFLAVYPNEAEDLDQIAAHAADRDTPFPVLKH